MGNTIKYIALSIRNDLDNNGLKMDAVDPAWYLFLNKLGLTPLLIPNHYEIANTLFSLPIQGVILTGGNTIKGENIERDLVETSLLEHALSNRIPLLGICRGMQLILDFFGFRISSIDGHVAKEHPIVIHEKKRIVNSFHNFACHDVKAPLEAIAKAEDGSIEAIRHQLAPIYGIMWHPERETPFQKEDLEFVLKIFNTLIKNSCEENIFG